jgi:hypothetical protein
MIRAALNYVARAFNRATNPQPRQATQTDARPLCAHESDHHWEAAWIGDDLVYWRCLKCPAVRESFGDLREGGAS